MDVEDSTAEFLEDLFRGSSILEWDELCVGGKAVHYDHVRCIAIGFVKKAGEVYGWELVSFVGDREGKGSSTSAKTDPASDPSALRPDASDASPASHASCAS